MQKLAIVFATASFLLLAPRGASAIERCYDELGVKIPGACEDQQQATPAPSGPASSGTSEFSSGDPAHRGFFLRFNLGGGPNQTQGLGDNDEDFTIGDAGGHFGIEIGGALFPGFAVYGLILATSIVGPKLTVNDDVVTTDDQLSFSTSIVGAGATYYLPWNIYLDGAVGIARHQVTYDGPGLQWEIDSDPGLGILVGAGKEWMVSDSWGLGLGVSGVFSKVNDEDDAGVKTEFTGASVGFTFSATYF